MKKDIPEFNTYHVSINFLKSFFFVLREGGGGGGGGKGFMCKFILNCATHKF